MLSEGVRGGGNAKRSFCMSVISAQLRKLFLALPLGKLVSRFLPHVMREMSRIRFHVPSFKSQVLSLCSIELGCLGLGGMSWNGNGGARAERGTQSAEWASLAFVHAAQPW